MSKRAKPDPDLAAWCAALACSNVDEVPSGWHTAAELAGNLGKTVSTLSHQLARSVREGKAEVQKFRIQTSRGPYPVPHYRLK
jgi:hypothetical protein